MNVVESILNVVFLILAARHSPVAVLVGAIVTAMTASKTILYWLCDIVSTVRPSLAPLRNRKLSASL